MINLSLKTKMAVAVSLLFVAALSAMALFTLVYFEDEFNKSISDQQFSYVSSLAHQLDDKIRLAQQALLQAAAAMPAEALTNPDKAQKFLDSKTTLKLIFDNAVFVFSKDGKIVAESPYLPNRRGKDFSFREYFRKTVEHRKSYISGPYPSTRADGAPALMITVPLLDARGEVKAILAGSLGLLNDNFLGDMVERTYGKTGYVYIVSLDKMTVVHHDRDRIMTKAPAPGVNPLLDRAFAGFEGSGLTVNSQKVRLLTSFVRLKATDWIVSANLPLTEAYQPLYKARTYFIVFSLAGMGLILVIVWLLMRKLTSPLLALTEHVRELPNKVGMDKLATVTSEDEIGILAVAFNSMISAMEEQKNALQESEANFRAIADNANEGILIAGREGVHLYANRRIAELTGYSCDELVGMRAATLIHPGELPRIMDRYRLILEGGTESEQYETRIVCKNGEVVPVEVASARTMWHGAPAGLVLVRDIAERKAAEEKIRQLNADLEVRVRERTAELEASNRELEAFSYTVAHDLRTPLRSLDGFSHILAEEYADRLDESGRGYLARISSAAIRMGQLIDDLLNLSRVARSELVRTQTNLSSLVRDIETDLRQIEPGRKVEILIAGDVVASGDPRLLRVALENLLANAWKFTGKREDARIEFGVCDKDGQVTYFVRDNGVGFDLSRVHNLFVPFQRLHGSDEFAGTGIGLATVHRIISRHGGQVWAEAKPGCGATVYFTLG